MVAAFGVVKRLPAVLAWFLAVSTILPAQAVRLNARLDKNTVRLGEWIDIHVDATAEAGVDSVRPALGDSLGTFEVLSARREGSAPTWLVRLSTIDTGKAFIPPLRFGYRIHGDTTLLPAYSNALMVEVTGMKIDPNGEIRDIKPPMSAPWLLEDFVPYIIGLVILIILVAGFLYYRWWRIGKQKRESYVRPELPAHVEALRALRGLEEKKLWQQGKVKEYYSEATEIVRQFFERRWSILALEQTSDEILASLAAFEETREVWQEVRTFLLTADLVKFAKHLPTPAENEQEIRSAYTIVRAMIPKAPVAEQPVEEEGAK